LEQDETQTNVQEEKVSFRSLLLKALATSVVIELLLCLATAPRLLALLGGFLFFMLGSADAASLRPMSLGVWKGIDSDRRVSLGQLGQDADRLSNLEFEAPTEVPPTEFWKYPIVFHSSTSRLSPLSQEDQQRIRDYCERGGLIIFDDPLATTDSQFYQSVKNEMSKIFPGRDLKKISKEDVIFRTFYLLNEVSGRKLAAPYLEGISFDNRWVVLFSFNDLLGATFRTPRGDYGLSVTPYGISQRVLAQRLLVNFLMYGATIDYKDDAIHLPHILKRRVR
jgi:hypothetical protein